MNGGVSVWARVSGGLLDLVLCVKARVLLLPRFRSLSTQSHHLYVRPSPGGGSGLICIYPFHPLRS